MLVLLSCLTAQAQMSGGTWQSQIMILGEGTWLMAGEVEVAADETTWSWPDGAPSGSFRLVPATSATESPTHVYERDAFPSTASTHLPSALAADERLYRIWRHGASTEVVGYLLTSADEQSWFGNGNVPASGLLPASSTYQFERLGAVPVGQGAFRGLVVSGL